MYICFGVTLTIRLLSVKFNWHLAKVQAVETISLKSGEEDRINDKIRKEKSE